MTFKLRPRRRWLRVALVGALALVLPATAGAALNLVDTTPPTCSLTSVIAGPPKQLVVTVQDAGSGLDSIEATIAVNAAVSIDPFIPHTTSPVLVTLTKIDQTLSSQVALEVKDAVGNTTVCDPVVALSVRVSGQPQVQAFGGLAQSESRLTVLNGSPGVTNLQFSVNGHRFALTGLADNAQSTLDVSAAMLPGSSNIVTVTAGGKPGASATVVISD